MPEPVSVTAIVTSPAAGSADTLMRPLGERRPGLAGERRDVALGGRGLPVPRLDPRQVEQLVHQALHAVRVVQDRAGEALRLRIGLPPDFGGERLRVPRDGREGRFQLVRYVGDEVPAHRLEPPHLGHVADDEQRAAVRQGPAGDEEAASGATTPSAIVLISAAVSSRSRRRSANRWSSCSCMARSATLCWAISGTRESGNVGARPAAIACAAAASWVSGFATSRDRSQASAPAVARAASPARATARCTVPTRASTAASVVDTRTAARPGDAARTATYMRRSLVDSLSRAPRPTPSAKACCTSGRMR